MIFTKPPILCILFLFCAIGVKAQCVSTDADPCITVKQSTIDRAMKAVTELQEARKAIAAFQNERGASEAERAAYKNALAVADTALTIFQKGVADRETLIQLQAKVIETLSQLVDRLQSQANKGKSAWAKFADVLKTVVTLAAGVTLGRGI